MIQLTTAPHPEPEVPTLHTSRLVLRPLCESDLPAVQRNFEDYETVRYLAAVVPWPYPSDGAATWFRDIATPGQGKDHWTWVIALKEASSELIGLIELFEQARPSNRGFWLTRSLWGRGYMSEAVEAVNDYAFDVLGFERLLLDNALGNAGSARIKDKTGARLIEVVDAQFVDPSITKMERWELTKEAWHSARRHS